MTVLGFSPTRIARALLYVTLVIFVVTVARSLLVFVFERPTLFGLAQMLDADKEANLISWYSSSLLLLASLMLGVIAAMARLDGGRYARTWAMLAVVFLFLSADEACCIHESVGDVMYSAMPTSGYLRHAWVIPWGALMLSVGLISIRLLRSLPRQIGGFVLIGAIIYAGGAIGVEMSTGAYMKGRMESDFAYSMMVNVEESMEMLGVVVFIHALGLFMESRTAEPTGETASGPAR